MQKEINMSNKESLGKKIDNTKQQTPLPEIKQINQKEIPSTSDTLKPQEQKPKKKKTGLIIGISALVILTGIFL